jgi:hypothetical protein
MELVQLDDLDAEAIDLPDQYRRESASGVVKVTSDAE